MNHYLSANPQILGNENLREPQLFAYQELIRHYSKEDSDRNALVVLPTGTGKTGLMAIAPYGIAKKRVLVITPQTVVKDTVVGSLNPMDPTNFWLTTKIFPVKTQLPTVIEYSKELTGDVLESSDIVILNIHKLQLRLESSLLKKVVSNFFDLIIVDEAHHSEAHTWKKAIEYFSESKVIKVTGTPFRSDGVKIEGTEVYKYRLSQAMANGYVKSLERFVHIPDSMQFTIDKNDSNLLSLEEVLKIKSEEWVSRSVALSYESNMSIVNQSVKMLEDKRRNTENNPHKIVAVACSIEHAVQLQEIYEKKGLSVAIVHSKMEKKDLKNEFDKIESNQVDVVVNVALLGEGYDHKFLTIAAIFRPFKSDLPYQQFIGRVLRSISVNDGYPVNEDDNIAQVVHHKELNLEELWKRYKEEIDKSSIIKELKTNSKAEREFKPTTPMDELDFGATEESESSTLDSDVFLATEFTRMSNEKRNAEQQRITKLMNEFGVTEEVATGLSRQIEVSTELDSEKLLRPDLYQKNLRANLAVKINEEIIPDIITQFNVSLDSYEITEVREKFIANSNKPPYHKEDNNGATLGIYFNASLKQFTKKNRKDWDSSELERAIEQVEKYRQYVVDTLNEILKKE